MRLIDIVNGPWAILPETHREIQDIYVRHLKGEKIDVKSLDIQKKDPLASPALVAAAAERQAENRGTYLVVDNVAVIPVHDVIAKRMTFFMEICGGTSSQILMRDFAAAQNDPSVIGIILYFDTPGGTVDGTMEASEFIQGYQGQKPVVGFTDGMIASAGVWIAAPCDSIYISSNTNPIGSIGVVAAHVDVSKRMEMFGQRVTEITAGDYKRVASAYSPLSDEGRAYIQAQLDHIYTAFTDAVGSNRGLSVDDHKQWADGHIFLGSQAIEAGLVDGVSTLDDLIAEMAAGRMKPKQPIQPQQKQQQARAGVARVETTLTEGETTMTREEFQAKHPELFQAILEEGRAAAAATTGEAVAAETGRVLALVTAAFGDEPGKKFAAAAARGLTADDFQALGISFTGSADKTEGDEASRSAILKAIQDAGQQPLKTTKGEEAEKDFMTLVKEHQAANADCSMADAMKAVTEKHPEAYAAYIAKANEGRN
jgi:signal peptide peptidase SppA